MEIWKDVEGYEGLYQVSNEGRVRSLNYNHTGEIQILSPSSDYRGYKHVNLFCDGKRRMKLVHRLVAEAFIDNPDNLPEVNHKNEDKTLNTVENLEWCTVSYNNSYNDRAKMVGQKLRIILSGRIPISNPPKKVYQYTNDGELVKVWESKAECDRNGFHHVSECCNGKRKQDKGYKWSYKPL